MNPEPTLLLRNAGQRLADQFNWRLLDLDAWVDAASQVYSGSPDDLAARRACLTVYSSTLHAACQDPTRWNQAYRELYDYLWPQAAARSPEVANELAQGAIVRVFEAFQSDQQRQRPRSAVTFLRFAQLKLREAERETWNEQNRLREEIGLSYDDETELDEMGNSSPQAADPSPPVPDIVIIKEERQQRARWIDRARPYAAEQVLACLAGLWCSKRLRRQLAAVIFTHIDCIPDDEIAGHMRTSKVNVQPLRSRGLDHVGECLRGRLAKEALYGSSAV